MKSSPVTSTQAAPTIRREHPVSTSCDTLSDSYSISSDDLDNFTPRIIRPRRRRKKEQRRKKEKEVESTERGQEGDNSCLGAEKQWLPQGLLSAESSFDSRSESGSSEEDAPVRRKLGPALSMPTYTSYTQLHQGKHGMFGENGLGTTSKDFNSAKNRDYSINSTSDYNSTNSSDYSSLNSNTSDYSSLNSNASDTQPSSSTDHLCDSDSSRSESDHHGSPDPSTTRGGSEKDAPSDTPKGQKPALKMTKSTSSSFFRSPMMTPKLEAKEDRAKRILRKTNSWHQTTYQDDARASFSLFSPAGSIDLLSGVRKNLSKLDINSEDE